MKKYFTIQLFTSWRINTESIVWGFSCTLIFHKGVPRWMNCINCIKNCNSSFYSLSLLRTIHERLLTIKYVLTVFTMDHFMAAMLVWIDKTLHCLDCASSNMASICHGISLFGRFVTSHTVQFGCFLIG